jgi:aminoglycoside phosphotransferase (APT) family kinase protein
MTPPTADDPGPLLARGRAADVFALDGDRVLRRYRTDYDAAPEARLIEHVRAHGFPTAAVFDVGGRDLVLARVDGPTMVDDFARHPASMRAHMRTLAALHARLHAVPVPEWLVEEPAGSGTAIVHLDLHPLNVLITRDGPIVIDWTNAGRGPAGVDIALTWLLLRTGEADDSRVARLAGWIGRPLIARIFRRAADPDGSALRDHLAAAARYRLSDRNLRPGEQRAIRRLVDTTA